MKYKNEFMYGKWKQAKIGQSKQEQSNQTGPNHNKTSQTQVNNSK
jgi:hypothetical protein